MLIKEPKKVAELLATFLEWKAAQGLEINSVYFAAPPTEMKFILDVRTVRSPVRPRIFSYMLCGSLNPGLVLKVNQGHGLGTRPPWYRSKPDGTNIHEVFKLD